jgi:hypothetical protein
VTSRLFRKSFNCRYNPRMDYAFCLLTLKSSEKWRSSLFGATCNFNDQILPYGILFLAFINTDVFYLLLLKNKPPVRSIASSNEQLCHKGKMHLIKVPLQSGKVNHVKNKYIDPQNTIHNNLVKLKGKRHGLNK